MSRKSLKFIAILPIYKLYRKLAKGINQMAISVYEQLNNMGLNIDRTTLQQVSQSILKRAEEKNSQYKVDNTQNYFQKRDIGVDLYNAKVDLKTANQIALNNSGLQIQLSQNTVANINYLNTIAAQNAQKSVEGKLSISFNDVTLNESPKPVNNTNRIVAQETAKDKNGSNPFYHGELLMTDGSAKSEENGDEKHSITSSIFL